MGRLRHASVVSVFGLVLLAATTAGQNPPEPLHRVERGQPLEPCPLPDRMEKHVARESRGADFLVDSCGRKVSRSGDLLPFRSGSRSGTHLTIDRMTTSYSGSHSAGGSLTLAGAAGVYTLSDGTSWSSGAGSYFTHASLLDHVEVSGTTLRYVLMPPASGLLYEQIDYDAGDHSAWGELAPAGALVLVAENGATTATLRGNALIVANDATWYGEPRFNYYTAIVGSVVPFELVYTMQGGTWTADAFSRPFSYTVTGFVDFAHPVSTPRAVSLSIHGPSQVPDDAATRFTASVRYENDVQRDVSSRASWTVASPVPASIAGGLLTLGALQAAEVDLTLSAAFVEGSAGVGAEKRVRVLADATAEKPGTWPMFQANARHTGYLPVALDPATFQLKWQKNVGSGGSLNPVAAGDGKVFVTQVTYFEDVQSLFALRASDGATLWSKGFGDIFSVNPPSYAYGNVYVQTGNHGTDTWLRAFDGATGDTVFTAPHEAQWERYFAPTISDGKAYINGGYYGGMYSFDAYSGDELWFADLPQYDQWTPAVDDGHAYAYVGEYVPGLYVKDRVSGEPAFFVSDPGFDWNGWSMNLAPVLGDHEDVIAIHDGRLISFDTASHAIRWEVASQFTGQPSLAHGLIYAIDGGRLRVLDELTHAELWSWQTPEGSALAGPLIVTDRYVFASTGQRVHAVDLTSRQSVWSYPVAGHLAIAEDTLYVASPDGKITAFASPSAGSFFTVVPCRVVDTRHTSGVPVGGPALAGGVFRSLPFAGHCGVPLTAAAVSVNVTVTAAEAPGEVRLGASSSNLSLPILNYSIGQTRTNNAIAVLGPNGGLTAFAAQTAGTTVHLVIDVNGYFE